jgi:hypothetical protein
MAEGHTCNTNSLSPHVQAAVNLVYGYLLTENMVNALLAWDTQLDRALSGFSRRRGFATGGIPLDWRRRPQFESTLSGFS